ncbi:MAG TPA: hypothetical protein VF585_10990 [Chthoniobacterales bacterium]|jgi:hypothetical protein
MSIPLLLCIFALCLTFTSAAETNKKRPAPALSTEMVDASYELHRAAVRRGLGDQHLIPHEDWPPEIRRLKPVVVYSDRANLAIVLSRTETKESGLYVFLPVSSYIPTTGNGWQFETQPNGIYRFTRTIIPARRK